jgi:prolyl-tRNA synthetase
VKYDNRDSFKPGWKFAEYEQKGVPVRIAIGPRDLENGEVEVARRDTKEKKTYNLEGLTDVVVNLMDEIHQNIYQKALAYREDHISHVDTYDEFKQILETKGGFIYAHWDGTDETEQMIKEETKATIRLIPLEQKEEEGVCIYSGKPSKGRVVFAIAY